MFLTRLNTTENELTKNELLIAEYFRSHLDNLKNMTSFEVANALKVSQSSIIRFSQKLGYKGYRELQLDIPNNDNETSAEILASDTTEIVNNKIVAQYTNIINLTNQLNKPQSIDKAVKYIIAAKRIVIYGVGNSGLFAEYLSNHLRKMGFDSFYSTNSHIINSTAINLTDKDLIIALSETGETRESINLGKIAKNNDIPMIALTRFTKNKLQTLASLCLFTCNDLSGSRLNAMTIRCSQLILIDMICLSIIKSDIKKYSKFINCAETLLDKNFFDTFKID